MNRKLASIQRIVKLEPIQGADLIEKATVLGWNLVVRKGEFKEGDLCVYFEVDSLLPIIPEFEFLSKSVSLKKMAVDDQDVIGYRLKTIRLKGQISQGLVLPINLYSQMLENRYAGITNILDEGFDATDLLGVFKYEAPIPAQLAGSVRGMRPSFVPKTDETRIQTVPHILEKYQDTNFVVTEKLDGSSISVYMKDGKFGVCSRNLDLLRDENNTMWKVVTDLNIEFNLSRAINNDPVFTNNVTQYKDIVLQGEIVGEGIQGNPLKIKGYRIYFYNIYDINNGIYLNYPDFIAYCDELGLDRVPVLFTNFTIPKTTEQFVEWVSGMKSSLNTNVKPEGIVVRSWVEQKDEDLGRLSFKVINPLYLLENGE